MHSHPVKQPNLTRTFPTGLMAVLVMRLADHLPLHRVTRLPFSNARVGADQGNQVGCVNRAEVCLGGFDELAGLCHLMVAKANLQNRAERSQIRSGFFREVCPGALFTRVDLC
jgi:hypothetical protein